MKCTNIISFAIGYIVGDILCDLYPSLAVPICVVGVVAFLVIGLCIFLKERGFI